MKKLLLIRILIVGKAIVEVTIVEISIVGKVNVQSVIVEYQRLNAV